MSPGANPPDSAENRPGAGERPPPALQKTDDFSTPDASGSTSQAANILEALEAAPPSPTVAPTHVPTVHSLEALDARPTPLPAPTPGAPTDRSHFPKVVLLHGVLSLLEGVFSLVSELRARQVGARTLLIDEDTAATNFMIRDQRMMQVSVVPPRASPPPPLPPPSRTNWTRLIPPSLLTGQVSRLVSLSLPTLSARSKWNGTPLPRAPCGGVLHRGRGARGGR